MYKASNLYKVLPIPLDPLLTKGAEPHQATTTWGRPVVTGSDPLTRCREEGHPEQPWNPAQQRSGGGSEAPYLKLDFEILRKI